MKLGDAIKTYRKEMSMTQAELGQIIGKKTITIRKYESGDITPSIDVLTKIASALCINVFELLSFTENNVDIKKWRDISNLSPDDRIFLESKGYIKNNSLLPNITLDLEQHKLHDGSKTILLPSSFDELKENSNNTNSLLQSEVIFLTNSIVERTFNYSYTDLVNNGYEKLLIKNLEKSISDTICEINTHIENGDIFDGNTSWLIKDSPLYKKIKRYGFKTIFK